jgi:hypothetical protein
MFFFTTTIAPLFLLLSSLIGKNSIFNLNRRLGARTHEIQLVNVFHHLLDRFNYLFIKEMEA